MALDGLDLDVLAGGVFGFLGPGGHGIARRVRATARTLGVDVA